MVVVGVEGETNSPVSAPTLRQGSENNPYVVLKIIFFEHRFALCVKVKAAGCLWILLMNCPVRPQLMINLQEGM